MAASTIPSEFIAPKWVYPICMIIGALFFFGVYSADRRHQWLLAGFIAFASSYVAMLAAAVGLEHCPVSTLLDPSRASWAFMFGDIALGIAVGAASYARTTKQWQDGWGSHGASSALWAIMAWLLGWTLALGFHFAMDKSAYVNDAHPLDAALWYAPSKLTHDFVTYAALGAALVYLCMPVLISSMWRSSSAWWIMLIMVLFWGAMGARDGTAKLDVWNLHPAYSWQTHQTVTRDELARMESTSP